MSPQIGDVPPDRSEEWQVTHIGRRAKWGTEYADCAVCETRVRLDTTHYYATLNRGSSGYRRGCDEELVFCGLRCLDRWRNA